MAPAAKRRRAGGQAEAVATAAAPTEWTYDRLWDAPAISSGWHTRNQRFWKSQSADIRGATGGGVSQRDLAFTKAVVADLARPRPGARFGRGLDLGAGIGRVTEAVLRHHCDHVDLVEFVRKHLDKAKEKLGEQSKGCSFRFHGVAVQKFGVAAASYDLILCQWLLMYLTDADALDVLRKLGTGLSADGVVLVKENVSTPGKLTYFDDAEGELWEEGDGGGGPVSVVRTEFHYEDLFERAGLRVRERWLQDDPTGKTMDMAVFALVPEARSAEMPVAVPKAKSKVQKS